jgi:hypothetical protein
MYHHRTRAGVKKYWHQGAPAVLTVPLSITRPSERSWKEENYYSPSTPHATTPVNICAQNPNWLNLGT